MPGFDQTGPSGAGVRTGRGRGRCVNLSGSSAGQSVPVYGVGRGGIPRGCGAGSRNSSGARPGVRNLSGVGLSDAQDLRDELARARAMVADLEFRLKNIEVDVND